MSKQKEGSKNLAHFIYNDVKRKIMTLELAPGSSLKEVEISQMYDASRTPVREVIKELMFHSFIEYKEGRGNIVCPLSVDSYNSIFQLRSVLEILSTRLATINWTQKDMVKLKENIEKQKVLLQKDYAPLEFLNLDREFHKLLVQISGNPYLCKQLENMYDHCFRYNYFCDFENRYSLAINEHERILNFVVTRNIFAAQEEMKTHLSNINSEILIRLAKKL
ncbi:MAG: GntR family transcriptional regulator [Tissierellia bacterium]|nr:GntR family transcriptional regulator [Tissierellia bacterium]